MAVGSRRGPHWMDSTRAGLPLCNWKVAGSCDPNTRERTYGQVMRTPSDPQPSQHWNQASILPCWVTPSFHPSDGFKGFSVPCGACRPFTTPGLRTAGIPIPKAACGGFPRTLDTCQCIGAGPWCYRFGGCGPWAARLGRAKSEQARNTVTHLSSCSDQARARSIGLRRLRRPLAIESVRSAGKSRGSDARTVSIAGSAPSASSPHISSIA